MHRHKGMVAKEKRVEYIGFVGTILSKWVKLYEMLSMCDILETSYMLFASPSIVPHGIGLLDLSGLTSIIC